jgi:hypothetical protein
MFQSVIKSTVPFVFALALLGCGSSSVKQSNAPLPVTHNKYTHAYVANVSVTLMDDAPDDQRITEKQNLEQKLPAVIKQKLKEEGLQLLAENPGKREGFILINAKVKYDPGNRALRWVAGIFGAGKGTVEASIEAIDSNSGRVVATEAKNESKRMGGAGGNFYGLVESTVEDITEDLTNTLIKIKS